MIFLDFLKSEDKRVELALKFVTQCNSYTRQKPGGQLPSPSVPQVIGQLMSCVICVTRGTCMGKSCLGDNGKSHLMLTYTSNFFHLSVIPKVDSSSNLSFNVAEVIDGKIPGSQATSLSTDGNARKLTKTNRFVFSYQLKSVFMIFIYVGFLA